MTSIQINDINRYDRQIRTFGIEASIRIQASNVYIIGLKDGYAAEICKNLALSGVNTINIVDMGETIEKMDSYYYKNSSIHTFHSTLLKNLINEMNSMVKVNIKHNIDNISNNSIMIVINMNLEKASEYNIICRKNNCKMVHMMCNGLAGSIFVDAIDHTVMDTSGENKESIMVKNITIDTNMTQGSFITVYCDRHNLNINDKVRFKNLQGNNVEYLYDKIFNVIDTCNHNFKIKTDELKLCDLTFSNGMVEYIMTPTTFNHKSLHDSLIEYNNITKNLDMIFSKNYKDISNEYLYTKDLYFEPVTSIMCGFASTEIIKLISCKYTPLNQWFTWSDHTIFNDYSSAEKLQEQYTMMKTNLMKQNILLAGCGALGCEWLKIISQLGCNVIDVVDPDSISESNLSRQFLFRPQHVGMMKSNVVVDMIKKNNVKMNINSHQFMLSDENKIQTEQVFKDKTIVINALDNIKARKFIDMNCFNKILPLFESGTMGMKGNTVPIIPYITETYSNSNEVENEDNFPICTIKNFPNMIVHTIHWARDMFEIFNRGPMHCNNYNSNSMYLDTLSGIDKKQAISDIYYFLSCVPNNINDIIMMARNMYEKNYNHDIVQLLHCFPSDHMIDGKPFWSHGKKCPTPLDFTSNIAIDYIEGAMSILCMVYGIDMNFTRDDIIDRIKTFTINEYKVKDIKIATKDSEIKNDETISECINLSSIKKYKLNPIEFEKDDDNHIKFITASSNCRAINYKIEPITQYETKGIVGKIIPAVATTTSTIVGLIAMELLRYIVKMDNDKKAILTTYRSYFLNMADNTIIFSEPPAMPKIKIGSTHLNGWTKFRYSNDSTLEEFINYYSKMFNTTIFMILYQTSILYVNTDNSMIGMKLSELVKIKCCELTIISDNDIVDIPPIMLSL